ncbi:MAG: hypothetical protein MMC33_010264 [Icmadophila ericetorum]|nr:hypothetical protein [Icmadophila ericetorum]
MDSDRPRCHKVHHREALKERCHRPKGVCLPALRTELWPNSFAPIDITNVVKSKARLALPRIKVSKQASRPQQGPKERPKPTDPSHHYPEWDLYKALNQQRQQAQLLGNLRPKASDRGSTLDQYQISGVSKDEESVPP